MIKAAIVLALAACVSAGVGYVDHHVGSAVEQTVRGYGGLSSISHQAKNVNSAFSTSSAYKTKVTNNAFAPVSYAAPAYAAPVAYAQPALAHAPVAYAQPAYAAPAYAAPAYAHPIARAPVAVAHAPVAYAHAPVAKVAHPAGLLGVAYSPVAPGVATLSFDGFGVHYGY